MDAWTRRKCKRQGAKDGQATKLGKEDRRKRDREKAEDMAKWD